MATTNGSAANTEDSAMLFSVVLTTSHIQHDVNQKVEKLRICGSFTNLKAAKDEAHKVLFELAYEREWFDRYLTTDEDFKNAKVERPDGLITLAVAPDGTNFRVSIKAAPNNTGYVGDEDGKIHQNLYHVVQTNVVLDEDEDGALRETNVEGTFTKYDEARKYAHTVLLSEADNITKDSYEVYEEAKPGENDCGYGENVVVHAIGKNGTNILVSVLKGQEAESERLAEAAMLIR